MRKTIALSALAGWLIAWNWLRLETGTSFGQAVLIVTLAIAPAVFRSTPTRATAALVGFLIAAGSAFRLGPVDPVSCTFPIEFWAFRQIIRCRVKNSRVSALESRFNRFGACSEGHPVSMPYYSATAMNPVARWRVPSAVEPE